MNNWRKTVRKSIDWVERVGFCFTLCTLVFNHYFLQLNVKSDYITNNINERKNIFKISFTLLKIFKANFILIYFIFHSGSRGSPAFPGGSTLGIKMKKKEGSIGGSKSASKAASRAGSACSQFSTHSKRSLKGDNKVLQPPVCLSFLFTKY